MSKPRSIFTAYMDTENHSNQGVSAINSELIGMDVFENHGVSSFFDPELGEWILSVNVRFNSRIDRDDLDAFLKNRSLNRIQTKAWFKSVKASTHLCSHDDPSVKDCKTTEYVEWRK